MSCTLHFISDRWGRPSTDVICSCWP
jgi:hypothetical protein